MINVNLLGHVLQLDIFLILTMFFMFKVFEEHLTVSKKGFLIGSAVHIVLLTLIVCLFLTQLSPFFQFAPVGLLLIFVLSIVIYKALTHKKMVFLFFILFILLNIQISALILARATLDFHMFSPAFSYENGDFLFLSSLYCVIIFCIVYFSLAKYYRRVVDDNIIMKHTKLLFCLPLLFFITLCILSVGMLGAFSKIPKELLLPLLLLNLFALVSYYAALKSIIDNYDASLEREKLSSARNQIGLWTTQYENLQNKIDFDARIRHDWRQHIIAIMGFVESKNLAGLEMYLADYKERYLVPDSVPICDIPSLDMLFQYYLRKASEEQIDLSVSTVLFGNCSISTSELTILFGNLLENAIEACERIADGKKYIRLKIVRDEYRIILLCENSFDGLLKRSMDRLLSRKENGGIGISSVQGIVQKYNGQMKIEDTDKVFKIYAFLQDEEEK